MDEIYCEHGDESYDDEESSVEMVVVRDVGLDATHYIFCWG